VDGQRNSVPHGTILGLQVLRWQGGAAAIFVDPLAGDIGIITCPDRDSTNIIKNKAVGVPGSDRRFDLADGVYIGSLLGALPQQHITITATGISLKDTNGNTLVSSGSGWALNGNLAVTGAITASGAITAGLGGADQVGLQTHKHSGVTTGAGVSGVPVPGT